jgi:Carboxypeptidase regulatory-like domain
MRRQDGGIIEPISLLTLIAAILTLASEVSGQSLSAGTLRGVISDATGGVLLAASVVLSNPITGFSRESRTDANGHFSIEDIPMGTYTLRVSLDGFLPVGIRDRPKNPHGWESRPLGWRSGPPTNSGGHHSFPECQKLATLYSLKRIAIPHIRPSAGAREIHR